MNLIVIIHLKKNKGNIIYISNIFNSLFEVSNQFIEYLKILKEIKMKIIIYFLKIIILIQNKEDDAFI